MPEATEAATSGVEARTNSCLDESQLREEASGESQGKGSLAADPEGVREQTAVFAKKEAPRILSYSAVVSGASGAGSSQKESVAAVDNASAASGVKQSPLANESSQPAHQTPANNRPSKLKQQQSIQQHSLPTQPKRSNSSTSAASHTQQLHHHDNEHSGHQTSSYLSHTYSENDLHSRHEHNAAAARRHPRDVSLRFKPTGQLRFSNDVMDTSDFEAVTGIVSFDSFDVPTVSYPMTLSTQIEDALNREIMDTCRKLLPTESDILKRQEFVAKIQMLVNREWPNQKIQVHAFGSTVNGLGSAASDVDLCLTTDWKDPQNGISNMFVLGSFFRKYGMTNIFTVRKAKVPICKFYDPITELSCDVNVNNILALQNTELIKKYVELDDRVRPFVTIIKHWAKQRSLNDAAKGGTLSSYCWVIMCINFLQTRSPPILPSLQKIYLDKVAAVTVLGNDSNNSPYKIQSKQNKSSLASLVYSFFRQYACEFSYPTQIASRFCRHLCVEEPFTPDRNLANSADAVAVAGLRGEFRRALDTVLIVSSSLAPSSSSSLSSSNCHGVGGVVIGLLARICEPYDVFPHNPSYPQSLASQQQQQQQQKGYRNQGVGQQYQHHTFANGNHQRKSCGAKLNKRGGGYSNPGSNGDFNSGRVNGHNINNSNYGSNINNNNGNYRNQLWSGMNTPVPQFIGPTGMMGPPPPGWQMVAVTPGLMPVVSNPVLLNHYHQQQLLSMQQQYFTQPHHHQQHRHQMSISSVDGHDPNDDGGYLSSDVTCTSSSNSSEVASEFVAQAKIEVLIPQKQPQQQLRHQQQHIPNITSKYTEEDQAVTTPNQNSIVPSNPILAAAMADVGEDRFLLEPLPRTLSPNGVTMTGAYSVIQVDGSRAGTELDEGVN
ncbi:hypothetical protein BDR26DRAFT_866925 [Obelidium mucronatum]|nr:hypothetical protein BDR26DRAFT_866925 [Obelidium mucronatum]